ncbi:somatostatin receptor type 5-like [Asterias amurensis]|uniref:somatostatin receptor type 5-like n=1 Tax=Asterias amurensis TaxID=7602 RepID=UPI003AB761AA
MLLPFMNDSSAWNGTGNGTDEDGDSYVDGSDDGREFGPIQIIAVTMFVVIFVGLIGNGAVIYIVVRHKDMHTTTNFSFANLAVTDFLFLLVHALTTSIDNIGFNLSLAINCWPTFYLRYVVAEVTCLTLALMSYDRYRMVAHPLDSIRHTKRRKNGILVCILLIWIISLALFSPVLIYTTKYYGLFCTILFPWAYGQKVFHTSAAFVMYVIPLSFIVMCYLMIFLKLRKPSPGEVGISQRSRRMRKTLRLILVVVVVFAMSWLLEHTFIVWVVWDPNFLPQSKLFTTTTATTKVILYVNSAANPFMYPFAGTGFTKHLGCFSLAVFSPVVIYSVNFYGVYCTIIFPWSGGQKLFQTAAALMMYVLPLSFIITCYLLIYHRLKKPNPGNIANDKGQRSRRMRKTLRLIMIVVIVFALSWLFEHFILVWLVWDSHFLGNSNLFMTSTAITKVILYVNSAANPFMYPFAGTGFTKHIWCLKQRGLSRSNTMATNRLSSGSTMKLSVAQSTVSTSVQSLDGIDVGVQTTGYQNYGHE